MEILEQHNNLVLLNSSNLCKGAIKRSRIALNIEEKSIIDFVIISIDLLPLVNSMLIDEERQYSLARFGKEKGNTVVTEPDHNMIITELNVSWQEKKIAE